MSDRPDKFHPGLSRRNFLRGLGGAAIGLPFLASALPRAARAQANTFPKRVIIFFSPNGTIKSAWRPVGTEYDWETSRILTPLEPFRDQLLVLSGIDMATARTGPGDGHQTGMGHMLTARKLLEGDLFEGGGMSGHVGWAGGISVDQAIANVVGKTTKFRSLELGVQVHGSTVWSRMSYLGPNQPVPPDNNPAQVFDRLFADVDADPAALARQRTRRKSVLDMVASEYQALLPRLGAFDREKLDQHLTAIREVEKRIDIETTGVSDICYVPQLGQLPDHMDPLKFREVGESQMDLMVAALACDLTRVASIQWSNSVSGHVFKDIGISNGHHDLSHEPDDNAEAKENLIKINTWYAERFAYLVGKLASVREGDGTLLDNTVVVWVNELGKGNSHSRDDVPYVLAGSCGGYFRTGRHLEYLVRPHNDFLLTLMHAMGLNNVNSFGDSISGTRGPMLELRA